MRTAPILAAAILLASPAFANFDLDAKRPHVPSLEILRQRCGGHFACTRFVSEELSARCVAVEAGWRIDASAKAVALVYYLDPSYFRHESLHIADMREAVSDYVASLESLIHPSRDECESRLHSATAGFPTTMKVFASQSMDRRH